MILGRFYSLVIVFFVVIGVSVETVHDGLVHLLSFGIIIYFCCHVFPSSTFVDILLFSCFWFLNH
jgi:hypothetical protein